MFTFTSKDGTVYAESDNGEDWTIVKPKGNDGMTFSTKGLLALNR